VAPAEWQPLIARIDGSLVHLNGGADRGMEVGESVEVCVAADPIVDPASGDVLGQVGERTVGRLRVVNVSPRYVIAEILEGGRLRVGQSCTRLAAGQSQALRPSGGGSATAVGAPAQDPVAAAAA